MRNRPPKNGPNWSKLAKIFFGTFLGPKCHFLQAQSIYIFHTKNSPMLFPHTVKNSFYKGVLLVRFFQTKKKVIFRAKFWTLIFFPLLMGSQPYLQGISTLRRPFRKKKCFGFIYTNAKYMVIFVEIPIFSKIMVKNGGSVGSEIYGRCQTIFKKIIFRYIALCSQSFVFIVLLVEEQYGTLFDFQKWHPPFFFFSNTNF